MRAALVIAALALAAAQRYTLPGQAQRQAASPAQELVSPAQEYLIPGDASVLGHWNASDLANGSARVGPAWTKVGAVPFNAGTTPPSVGPFSSANYYTEPVGGVFNFTSGPFTCVVILSATSFSGSGVPISTGLVNTGGFQNQLQSSGAFQFVVNALGSNKNVTTSSDLTSGAVSVLMMGMDASGKIFDQLNGVAPATTTGATIATSATTAKLGNYAGLGLPYTEGLIYEVQISKRPPSAALFTAIYQAIEANL